MINIVAKKIGMTHIFQKNGYSVPLTILKVYDNCVLDVIVNKDKNFDNLLLGFDRIDSDKKVTKSVAGIFVKKNIPLHRKIYGCRVTKNFSYSVGDILKLEHLLKEGDLVNITGTSIGKGFAGVMKRHNFRGLEASHGVSVSHRSHGSTGQRQDPGKVFKGKKMAGHMGVDKITTKNLEVLLVNTQNNTVAVKGCVPGPKGSDVIIKSIIR